MPTWLSPPFPFIPAASWLTNYTSCMWARSEHGDSKTSQSINSTWIKAFPWRRAEHVPTSYHHNHQAPEDSVLFKPRLALQMQWKKSRLFRSNLPSNNHTCSDNRIDLSFHNLRLFSLVLSVASSSPFNLMFSKSKSLKLYVLTFSSKSLTA